MVSDRSSITPARTTSLLADMTGFRTPRPWARYAGSGSDRGSAHRSARGNAVGRLARAPRRPQRETPAHWAARRLRDLVSAHPPRAATGAAAPASSPTRDQRPCPPWMISPVGPTRRPDISVSPSAGASTPRRRPRRRAPARPRPGGGRSQSRRAVERQRPGGHDGDDHRRDRDPAVALSREAQRGVEHAAIGAAQSTGQSARE